MLAGGLSLALIAALWPQLLPEQFVSFVLVLCGLLYGSVVIDSEAATDYLVVVIAAGGAAAMDVLAVIPVIGPSMDALLDVLLYAMYASAVAVLASRTWRRLQPRKSAGKDAAKPASDSEG